MFQESAVKSQKYSILQFILVNKAITQIYTPHDPIVVRNDAELAAIANSGNGTIQYPYVIFGWNITNYSSYGIFISGTTKHFRIEDCWISEGGVDWYHHKNGIFIENVTSGTATITNNTCNNNYFGISLGNANSSTVANNICSNNYHGIYLYCFNFSTAATQT